MLRQRITEALGKALGHALCLLRILADEIRDGVERVEEEMRIDLGAQRFQLRLGEQPLETLLAQQQRALLRLEVNGVEAMFELRADSIEEREFGLHQRTRLMTGGGLEPRA